MVEFPQGVDDIFGGAARKLGDFLACQRQAEDGAFVNVLGEENQYVGNPSLYLVVREADETLHRLPEHVGERVERLQRKGGVVRQDPLEDILIDHAALTVLDGDDGKKVDVVVQVIGQSQQGGCLVDGQDDVLAVVVVAELDDAGVQEHQIGHLHVLPQNNLPFAENLEGGAPVEVVKILLADGLVANGFEQAAVAVTCLQWHFNTD